MMQVFENVNNIYCNLNYKINNVTGLKPCTYYGDFKYFFRMKIMIIFDSIDVSLELETVVFDKENAHI